LTGLWSPAFKSTRAGHTDLRVEKRKRDREDGLTRQTLWRRGGRPEHKPETDKKVKIKEQRIKEQRNGCIIFLDNPESYISVGK